MWQNFRPNQIIFRTDHARFLKSEQPCEETSLTSSWSTNSVNGNCPRRNSRASEINRVKAAVMDRMADPLRSLVGHHDAARIVVKQ